MIDRIVDWGNELADRSGASRLQIGAVMHGMADHTHLMRVLELIDGQPDRAEALRSYLHAIADAHLSPTSDEAAGWGFLRIMHSQAVEMGTPQQYAILGYQASIPVLDVRQVLYAFTYEHCNFIVDKVIDGHLMLQDAPTSRPWPEATSLGRYFHALGDDAAMAAWEDHEAESRTA